MSYRKCALFFCVYLSITAIDFSCFGQSFFTINGGAKKCTIPFRLVNNVIVIKVKVNGTPLNFLLDTGVEETLLLDLQNEKEVILNEVETIKLQGFGLEEPISGLKAKGNYLEVGNLTSENHVLFVVLNRNIGFIASLGIQVNGILGSNFFKNNVVKIDYQRKRIVVYQSSYFRSRFRDEDFTAIPILLEDNKPYVDALVRESTTSEETISKFLIDSGLSSTLWFFSPNKKLLEDSSVGVFEDFLGIGFSGIVRGSYSRVDSVSLGNISLQNVVVAYPDSTFYNNLKLISNRGGSIGGEILRRFQVIFDYQQNMVYLKPNKFFSNFFSYNKSGIHLQRGDDRLISIQPSNYNDDSKLTINFGSQNLNVKYRFIRRPAYEIGYLRCDSPAERAGVHIGDVILKVNGTSTSELSLDQVSKLLKPKNEEFIILEVDRMGENLFFRFQLKNILD